MIFLLLFFHLMQLSREPLYDGLSFSRQVSDKNHQLLRLTLSGDEKYRIHTPLNKMSPQFLEAVLLLEDQYYYWHPGVNPWALSKAILSGGSRKRGASTITMQYARIRYGLKTRTWHGKLKQIVYALYLEATHSKNEILEAYLNLAPYGGPIEGVGAASLIYFGKKAQELTLSESLALAVIPQSPQRRDLSQKQEVPSLALAKNKLFKRWLASHPKDKNNLLQLQLPLSSLKIKNLPFLAPHFVEMVLKNSFEDKITTTLNMELQKKVEDKIQLMIQQKKNLGLNNAAVLVVNHTSNEIISYVGSGDFFNSTIEGQVDGLLAKRSPGSALKPFVYALAYQQGLIHNLTLVKDTPLRFAVYDPENFDQKFLGPLSAQEALTLSRNVPAIILDNLLKKPTFYDFLKSADMTLPQDANYYGLSLVLGSAEISPWNLAELYSMLANGGIKKPLTFENKQETNGKKLLSPESSFVTLDMLTQTQRPSENFNRDWLAKPYPVAWKTGTSHSFRDAWTVGVVGSYVIVVWMGNFDNKPNPVFVGREAAAPLFFSLVDLFEDSHQISPRWHSPAGLNLKKVKVCKLSGAIPHTHCPHLAEAWYSPGVSPIKTCNIHRPLVISKKTGLRSCNPSESDSVIEVYEFWPSDLAQQFEHAGIHRRSPPAFGANCSESSVSSGMSPQIVSPVAQVSYAQSRIASQSLNTLSFEAIADGDVKTLYWFLDKNFIGKTRPSESLSYVPEPGTHMMSVVDDKGRSDHRPLAIEVVR